MGRFELGKNIINDPYIAQEARRIDLLAHARFYEAGIREAIEHNNRRDINNFYARKKEILEEVAASFAVNHNSV